MWSFFQKNHYLGFNCFLPSQGIQAFIGLGLYAYSTSVNGKKGSKAAAKAAADSAAAAKKAAALAAAKQKAELKAKQQADLKAKQKGKKGAKDKNNEAQRGKGIVPITIENHQGRR